MLQEHDSVVAIRDLDRHGIKAGTAGAIVYIAPQHVGYLVEFFRDNGSTIDVVDVSPSEVRSLPVEEKVAVTA